ncbi:MAG: hypothetical protein Q9181_006181 [Wetmoreana brouardii]
MHHVKQWAHSAARAKKRTAWAQNTSTALATGAPSAASTFSHADNVQDDPEKEDEKKAKGPVWRRFYDTLKKICLSSWVNILLVFVPVGIAVNFAGVSPTVIFAINAIAIIPLAGMLAFATESVAHRLGDTLGALLNVSFGNAVELIIFIALVKNEIRIVQASLLGSILANLLLILGMSFLIGGLQYQEQLYNNTTAFHASFDNAKTADIYVLKVSRGTSVILLLVYILYLLFQLKSHAYLYKSTPQHIVDEESHPGILRRMHSSGSSSVTSSSTGASAGSRRITRKKLKAKLGKKRQSKIEADTEDAEGPGPLPTLALHKDKAHVGNSPTAQPPKPGDHSTFANVRPGGPLRLASLSIRPPPVFRNPTEPLLRGELATHASSPNLRRLQSGPAPRRNPVIEEKVDLPPSTESETPSEPPLSKTASVVLLLGSTALVALCAEFMVDSINELVANTPLSEAFVGLIILPIVGNAAEHVTAVTVAAKNKMDLAIGVAIGSSIQIATFITPLVVIIGWILDKDMPLYFTLFETVTLFVTTFVVNFLVLDGRSNYLEGSLLCSSYIIIAVAAFFFPNAQDQSSDFSGPAARRSLVESMAATNLGLRERDYDSDVYEDSKGLKTQWQGFEQELRRLNEAANPETTYKVLYMGRHGEGDHNVAERRYGRDEWDGHWAAQEGDSIAHWADAHLTELGIQQAQAVNAFWKYQIAEARTPLPERYYTSPMHRCLETANHTFSNLDLPAEKPYKPVVKEFLREVNGVHTCDRRSPKSALVAAFPNFTFEPGFAENDELWTPDHRESNAEIDERMQRLLDDIFRHDSSTFISFTCHSGGISSLLRVLGHREFRLPTGAVIPVLVKAESIY